MAVFTQEPVGSLLLSCTDDDSYDVASHGPSAAATSGERRDTSGAAGPSADSTAKKLLELRPFQWKKPSGAAIVGVPKPGASKMMLLKHSLTKTAANRTPAEAERSGDKSAAATAEVPSKKKTVRPAAWLLHSVGLRMVRERVYDDLIDIQEEKNSEGQLGGTEQRQLERLRGAHVDLVRQNRPYAVRARRRCRCGFAAGSRLELELHRDYGGVPSGDDVRFRQFTCCVCGVRNIKSLALLVAHAERSHGRQTRMHVGPPMKHCPFCPFEQRSKTKQLQLSRHVLTCVHTFRLDRNLALTAADADIPLFEVANPPVSSAAASSAGGLKSSSLVPPAKVLILLSHRLSRCLKFALNASKAQIPLCCPAHGHSLAGL